MNLFDLETDLKSFLPNFSLKFRLKKGGQNSSRWPIISTKRSFRSFSKHELSTIAASSRIFSFRPGPINIKNLGPHRTGPKNIWKSRTAPHRTKNIRKSRTNSDRVVRGPSGAWIPGFHMVYKLLSLIWKFQDITKIHGTIMITSSLCNRSFPLKVNHFPRYAIARGTSCKSLFLNILSQFLEIRLRNSPP